MAEPIGDTIIQAIAQDQHDSPRTQQGADGILGPSEIGGCREYVRAMIAKDPQDHPTEPRVKWAAFIGTVLGDAIESVIVNSTSEKVRALFPNATSQKRVVATLPRHGIKIAGSTDLVLADRVLDLKGKMDIGSVKYYGASFKHQVQISLYLLALIEDGTLPAGSVAELVYYDMAVGDPRTISFIITEEEAHGFVAQAEERLDDVFDALKTRQRGGELRDEPESYCAAIACPFYTACWQGYQPSEQITDERTITAVRTYAEGRRMKKDGEGMMRAIVSTLNSPGRPNPLEKPPAGKTGEHIINWKLRRNENVDPETGEVEETYSWAIDVRDQK